MPLDPARLANVHERAEGYSAACPACREEGRDKQGEHLRVWPDGAYGCAVRPGDHEHAKRIYALAGAATTAVAGWQRAPRPRVLMAATEHQQWTDAARRDAARILRRPWLPADIAASSPADVPRDPLGQARAVLSLFKPADIVWTGFLYESGRPEHAANFRPAREWAASDQLSGPRVCPCTFMAGSFARTTAAALTRRFLVVESDTLDFGQQGALIRWAMQDPAAALGGGGLRLRAVIHSGGKSLHAWFDAPRKNALAMLSAMLPALGADPALFSPVQPVRLPGWRRSSGKLSRLLYLAP